MENKETKKQPAGKKYTREALLSSKAFSMYQKDFLSVLLPGESYTLEEAQKIVDGFFGPGKKGK